MPRYDYQCGAGHIHESLEDRGTSSISCAACGRIARRVVVPGHAPGAIGFTPKPTKEHYVNVNRAIEAQHEIIYQAERHHIEPPDLWKAAKRRIARGDVKAIT